MNQKEKKMFSVRTDLAVEARELINEESIDGVEIYSEEDDGISTTVVHILNEQEVKWWENLVAAILRGKVKLY